MKSSDFNKHYFFQVFSMVDIAELLAAAKRSTHPAGEALFHQNDPSSSCFCLEFGSVRLGKKGPRHHVDSTVLGPGSVFGELAFLDRHERSIDAVALEAISVIEISFDAIEQILSQRPGLAEKLYCRIAVFLRDKLQHLPEDSSDMLARFQ